MARAAATEVTDRWKGFTRTLGLQYLNGDFEIAEQQHSTSLLYAEGVLTRKKAERSVFPAQRLLAAVRPARRRRSRCCPTRASRRLRAEAKWLQPGRRGRPRDPARAARRHGRRRLRCAAAGAALLRRRRPLDPRLRLPGDRRRQCRGRRDRRRVPGGRQRRVRALLPAEVGRRDLRRRRRRVHAAASTRTSAPASACAGNRRSGCCGWTSRGRWSRTSITPGAFIS